MVEHLPKMRGFKSHKSKNQVVDLNQLEKQFESGDIISPPSLLKRRLIDNIKTPVKILGEGKISKKLTIEKCLVSKSARDGIEKAGGKVVNDQ